jgi:hypothetical protein
MPGRSNEFQRLVLLLTRILRADDSLNVTESAMLTDIALGKRREVDVCVEGERDGQQVLIGIECRAWKRRQAVGWVEEMWGKHGHLPTSQLVVVSSSGFTKQALKLAEYYGIKAVTPGEVTPGFIGEIVNKLERLWIKKVSYTPTGVRFLTELPGGERREVDRDRDEELYFSDGSIAVTAQTIARMVLRFGGGNLPAIRDAVAGETMFDARGEGPALRVVYVPVPVDGQDPILGRIIGLRVVGKAVIEVVEMPLRHGGYEGANYSAGEAELGDQSIVSWAVVERGDGSAPQMAGTVKGASGEELTELARPPDTDRPATQAG